MFTVRCIMLCMRRVAAALLGFWWLLVLLPSAPAQTEASLPRVVVRVRGLQLDGADSIPESITRVAQQRIVGSKFLQDTLAVKTAARLRQVLYSFGYMEAVVDPPAVQREGDLADLTFHLDPGVRYTISGLAVGGVEAFPPQQIRDLIPFHPGDPVDDEKRNHALVEIRSLYSCFGYLEGNPQVLDNYHRETRTLFFTIQMHEGERSMIANVKVLGLEPAMADKLTTLPELQVNSAFSTCRIREAISALWPPGDPLSKLSYAIRGDRTPLPQKTNVLIDFTAGHTPQDLVSLPLQH